MNMNNKMDILTNASFWTSLAQRYFDAESTETEELVLKSFVASEASSDPVFDAAALELFTDVRATMSLIAVGKQTHIGERTAVPTVRRARWWKWAVAGVAAGIIGGTLLILPAYDGGSSNGNVCMASINGKVITDREEVLSLMHDSWADIDISSDGSEVVESQLKEMFGELE